MTDIKQDLLDMRHGTATRGAERIAELELERDTFKHGHRVVSDSCVRLEARVKELECAARKIAELEKQLAERASAPNPIAEVISKFGDPEAFGERELKIIADIQKMPYGTRLYATTSQQQGDGK